MPSPHPSVLRFPHPVLKSSQLRARQVRQISILEQPYALFRDKAGKVVAVRDACPHRGAPLTRGKVNAEGDLVCGYHGWRICSDGSAKSLATPAKTCRAAALRTWERHGFIWVAHPDVEDSALPAFLESDHELVAAFSMPFDAPLRVAVDNFSEVEHAFKIHRFIGPSAKLLDTVEFSAGSQGDQTYAFSSARYRSLPFGLSRLLGVKPGDRYHNDWTFKFNPLCGTYSNYWTSERGERRPVSFLVTTFFVPVRGGKAVLHTFLQIAITGRLYRAMRPLLQIVGSMITRYEIWADARIARFAPDVSDPAAGDWQLTGLDKQVVLNRRLTDSLYFGQASTSLVPLRRVAELESRA